MLELTLLSLQSEEREMEVKNGSICDILAMSGRRIVGDENCVDCLFNNNNYNPPEGYQHCVFQYAEDINNRGGDSESKCR